MKKSKAPELRAFYELARAELLRKHPPADQYRALHILDDEYKKALAKDAATTKEA